MGLIPFPLSTAQLVISIIDIISVGMVLLMVGILSLYQLYYVATNTTTIESFEKDRIFSHARRKKIKVCFCVILYLFFVAQVSIQSWACRKCQAGSRG